ncbi:glutamate-5-semialdehyde dehydrogenase [Treponema sp.]|uniref:glutamate-5-semialdehyde dehydrogenase n=1 Tax=Treponema sp. TaxID=166 RepID=UPI003F12B9D6
MELNTICSGLKKAAAVLAIHTEQQKNCALESVFNSIQNRKAEILEANKSDVEAARASGMTEPLVERLALDEKKFSGILEGIKTVIQQKDPVGKIVSGWKTPQGMEIRQVRVPLGVAAIIYESRPNVTADAFALAYKSGNSILLRGSSSALNSNKAIVSAIREGLKNAGSSGVESAVYLCTSGSHSEVNEILGAVGKIDVVLPRGSAKLINLVVENAKIPVIQTGAGVCHLYVDKDADLNQAAQIARNSKMQRPGACNAIETILVHREILAEFLPKLAESFNEKVQLRADSECFSVLKNAGYKNLREAAESDFGFEFLDFIASVRQVESTENAIEFINAHNTKHSECIVTNNRLQARMFQQQVDAACIYVNASTRFTDGGVFGFGAELGISTQKLHARGPMGAEALTTTKFLIEGDGQVR